MKKKEGAEVIDAFSLKRGIGLIYANHLHTTVLVAPIGGLIVKFRPVRTVALGRETGTFDLLRHEIVNN